MYHNILQSHIWSNLQHYLQTIYDTAVNKAVSMHSRATGQTPGLTPPRHSGTTHQLFVLVPSGRGLQWGEETFRTVCTCRGRGAVKLAPLRRRSRGGGDREGDI